MPWLAAGAIAGPLIGGLVGNAASQGDRNQALQLQQQALQNILNVNTPNTDAMKLALQQYGSAGQLAPEMDQTVSQSNSLMNNIQTDPRLKNAQMQALSRMQQTGAGGLRPEDRAALAQIRNSNEADEHGREASILQGMQQRGEGGSGAELAAQLASSQGAANRAGQQGLNVGAQASQAALQSIMNAGQLGGQIQQQSFGQQAQQANAQDVINRYNAMNSQQVGNQNVAMRNAAQAQNLANNQNIKNQNTQLSNQQQMFNNNLPQLNYQNQLGKAQAGAGQQGSMANSLNQNANATAGMFGGVGQGVGQGAAAVGQYNNNSDYLDILRGKSGGSNNNSLDLSNLSSANYTGPSGPFKLS